MQFTINLVPFVVKVPKRNKKFASRRGRDFATRKKSLTLV